MSQPTASQERAPEFAGYFTGLAQGQLRFPRCAACTRFHWYPMRLCPHCQSPDIHWHRVSGRGTLFSWTTVRHPFDPKLATQVPYIVGLVTFADAPGIRLVTTIIDAPPGGLAIGLPVEPVFRAGLRFAAEVDEVTLCFRPALSST